MIALRRLLLLAATGALSLGAHVAPASAATCDRTWNGSISSSWGEAGNWTPAGVPAASENVCVDSVAGRDEVLVDQGGTVASLTGNEPVRVTGGTLSTATGRLASLRLDGGALYVTGQELLVDGALDVRGGTLHGSGRIAVAPEAIFNISGAPSLAGITLDVRGVGSWTSAVAGDPSMRAGAVLLVSGKMDFAANDGTTVRDSSCCWDSQPRIRVAPGGLATRSTEGTMHFNVPFEVDGAAAPASGGLRTTAGLVGGSSGAFGGDGVFTVAGGGAGTIEPGASVAGRLQFAGGTTTLAAETTLTSTSGGILEISGGSLKGAGALDLAGTLKLSGGELAGSGAASVSKLEISGSSYLHERTVTLTGTGDWTGDGSLLTMTGTAAIVVQGTLDMRPTGSSYINGSRYGYWVNSPVVRIEPGGTVTRSVPGLVYSDIPFEVDGALSPADGEIRMSGGLFGTSTGDFGGAGLANIAGGSGSGVIGDGARVVGNLRVSGGTTLLEGTVGGTAAGLLDIAGGTLTGDGDMDLSGDLTLRGGDHRGAGTTTVRGKLSMSGAPFIFDRTVHLAAGATGEWTGQDSRPTIKGAGKLEIAGTFDMKPTHSAPDSGGSYFDNHRYGWWGVDTSSVRVAPGGVVTSSPAEPTAATG